MLLSDGEFEQEAGKLWLPNRGLGFHDRDVLQEDATWLSDVLINWSQTLLKQQ